ncbi:hypothetical protein Tco_0036204, partial [Tanacetum coccineum]
MYKLVKKLKKLKKPLNKLSWSQGNVYDRAKRLNEELKRDQDDVKNNPFDVVARTKAVQTLNDFFTPVRPIVENFFNKAISEKDAKLREVFNEEIKEALFDIDMNKASGPGRFSSLFFKKAWGIMGQDVRLAMKEFFRFGKLLGEVNATLIALIPKDATP